MKNIQHYVKKIGKGIKMAYSLLLIDIIHNFIKKHIYSLTSIIEYSEGLGCEYYITGNLYYISVDFLLHCKYLFKTKDLSQNIEIYILIGNLDKSL